MLHHAPHKEIARHRKEDDEDRRYRAELWRSVTVLRFESALRIHWKLLFRHHDIALKEQIPVGTTCD